MSETFGKMNWSFTAEDIPWDGGRRTFALWLSKQHKDELPARADFTPQELSLDVLPTIMLVDVHSLPSGFTVRLAGTAIANMMGRDPTGMAVSDLRGGDKLAARFSSLVMHGRPYLALSLPTPWQHEEYPTYDVLVLPLARNGKSIDMLMMNLHFG